MPSFEVKSDSRNILFDRRQVVAEIGVDAATPPRKEVLKLLSDKLSAAPDCIIIEKIAHRYGSRKATVTASVYDKAEDAKKEPAYKLERGTGIKKAAAEGGKKADKKKKK